MIKIRKIDMLKNLLSVLNLKWDLEDLDLGEERKREENRNMSKIMIKDNTTTHTIINITINNTITIIKIIITIITLIPTIIITKMSRFNNPNTNNNSPTIPKVCNNPL